MVLIDGVVYPDGGKTERDTLPRKKKMHILKKIRKHLGLADSACSMSSNLPPLRFHSVCGGRVRISRDGTTARRLHNDRYFSCGIAFSSRPVELKERIYLKISETAGKWSGSLRVGFTCINPITMEGKVPDLLVPNKRRLKGFWARAIPVDHDIQDSVVYFYVSNTGKLVICINGKKKVLCDGLNTRFPLWAAVDVYGNCTAVQLIDSNSNIIPELSRLNIVEEEICRLPIRFNDNRSLVPLPFHSTKGRNVHMSNDGYVASRSTQSYQQGYVFTLRPITFGEKIIIQVLKSDARYSGALAFGLTSCNPASLGQSDLPDDSDALLDRPEYWVVTKNVSSSSRTGDEIALCVTPNGEVTISKNGSTPVFLMNVDVTLQLWAFMDIYGSTESIRMFKHEHRQMSTYSINSQVHDNPGFSQSMTSSASCATMMSVASSTMLSSNNMGGSRIINLPTNNAAQGGTVLVLNLPSTSQNLGSLNGIISASQTLSKPLPTSLSSKNLSPWKEGIASECIICYENTIDSVVYSCGHMCMCHGCAMKQWRGAGFCPLCRAPIKDVIKPYTP